MEPVRRFHTLVSCRSYMPSASADVTCFCHLPMERYQGTIEDRSRERQRLTCDPLDNGVKRWPPGCQSNRSPRGPRESSDLKGATTIQLSPIQARAPAACRFPWLNRGHTHSTQTYSTQTYGWAGAATPTQRNTTPPQIPPRKDSAMFNATPVLGKDKTRWPIGNATETKSHRGSFSRASPTGSPT